jgi:PAS domain S-box-containing protein
MRPAGEGRSGRRTEEQTPSCDISIDAVRSLIYIGLKMPSITWNGTVFKRIGRFMSSSDPTPGADDGEPSSPASPGLSEDCIPGANFSPQSPQPRISVARIVHSGIARKVIVVLAILLAFQVRELLARGSPIFPPYVTFYPVVLLAALLGGIGEGILATVLAALLAAYYVLPPIGSFSLGAASDAVGLTIFFCSGILISAVMHFYHRNREKLAAYRLQSAVGTERRKTEVARQAAEATLGSIGDAVLATGSDGRVTFLNRAAAMLTGWPLQEALNQPLHDVFRAFDEESGVSLDVEIARLHQNAHTKRVVNSCRLMARDGSEFSIESCAAPILDNQEKFNGVVLVFRDVGEKRLERAAKAEAAALLDLAQDAILVFDLSMRIISWNRGAEEMYGYSRNQAVGRTSYQLLHTVFPKPLTEIEEELIREGHWEGELIQTSQDGREIVVVSRWVLQRGKSAQLSRVMAISSDITDRKRAEEALRESENAFATLANMAPQLVWMCTPDGLNVYFNQRWLEYTGLSQEESHGTGWNTPFHPEDKQAAWDAWNHATQSGEQYRVESRLRAADGDYRWFLMRGEPLRNAEGKIIRWFGTCTDIEEIKRAEETRAEEGLREHRAKLEAALASMTDAVFITDTNGNS